MKNKKLLNTIIQWFNNTTANDVLIMTNKLTISFA